MHPFLLHYPVLFSNVSAGGAPDWVLRGGIVPADIDIDFVNDRVYGASSAAITSVLSCSRGSGGYYLNADGTLTWFDSNTLRYGTNGLLVEESRTNLIWPTENGSTGWAGIGASPASSTQTLPTGSSGTAISCTDNGSATQHGVYCSNAAGTCASATTHTVSAYFKVGSRNYCALNIQGAAGNYVTKVFNLSTGALGETAVGGTSGTFINATITPLANGWYRCTMTGSITGSGTAVFYAANAVTGNSFSTTGGPVYTGAADIAIYVAFPQCEVGSFATSYFPTTTTTAARSADNIAFNSISWFSEVTGTMYAECLHPVTESGAGTYRTWSISTSSTTNELYLGHFNGIPQGVVTSGGVTQANLGTGTLLTASVNKLAMAYATNDAAASYNAGTVQTDNTVTLPTGITISNIGGINGSTINGSQYVRRLAYWNSRVSNTNLQTLTA